MSTRRTGAALTVAAFLWLGVLAAALSARMANDGVHSIATAIVYTAAGHVCHQKPERSYSTRGVLWPVCARCAGLYLGAPLGALWFLRRGNLRSARRGLLVAAVPTLATLAWEWAGHGMPANGIRLSTAIPLGAAIAGVLVAVTHRID